jgi:acetyl esterase/lipase
MTPTEREGWPDITPSVADGPVGPHGPYQVQVPNVAALVARGYAVASLNYRLGDSFVGAALPAIQDAKAAGVRFLRAHAGKYNLNPNQFAVWGNSAGGYTAAMLGVTGDRATVFDDPALGNAGVSSAVQACVVWFGAEDRHSWPARWRPPLCFWTTRSA